jgi:GNAT superfamily N-acetyltransferase
MARYGEPVDDRDIRVSDDENALADDLRERLSEFNAQATGMFDGRNLFASVRDDDGSLIGGAAGWTWGGAAYLDQLWVRADRRGQGIGTRLLETFESQARDRGCELVAVSTHSFQAPELYRRHGYLERGRVEGYPRGHAHIHLSKTL